MARIAQRPAFAGFALIGILVVLVIILIIYFGNGGGGSYAGQMSQARKQGRELSLELNTRQLTLLIATFRQTNGRSPKTWEELEAPASSYADPWGAPLTFTIEEERGGGRARVLYRSSGLDGQPGTEDDITKSDDLPL